MPRNVLIPKINLAIKSVNIITNENKAQPTAR